ncbi:MAG: DUF2975 domain-containing protein [Proteocatella sp.]
MKKNNTIFLKFMILLIGSIALLLCIFWLPWFAKSTADLNPDYAHLRFPVLTGIYITTIPFYFALHQAFKLLSHIEKRNAFSELAVTSLIYIKYCAIFIAMLYAISLLVLSLSNIGNPTIAIIESIIIFTSLTIALFSAVLQELLTAALEIKAENDLTV